MKKIIAALVAALFAATTLSVFAADEAKPMDKPAKSGKKHKKAKKEDAAAPTAATPAPAAK